MVRTKKPTKLTRPKPTGPILQLMCSGNPNRLDYVFQGLAQLPLAQLYPYANFSEMLDIAFNTSFARLKRLDKLKGVGAFDVRYLRDYFTVAQAAVLMDHDAAACRMFERKVDDLNNTYAGLPSGTQKLVAQIHEMEPFDPLTFGTRLSLFESENPLAASALERSLLQEPKIYVNKELDPEEKREIIARYGRTRVREYPFEKVLNDRHPLKWQGTPGIVLRARYIAEKILRHYPQEYKRI